MQLVSEKWMLVTVGVLTTVYTAGEANKMLAFNTTFNPSIVAITSEEIRPSYSSVTLFQMLKHVAFMLKGFHLAQQVRQYHCNWHMGEENAPENES